MLCIQKGRLVVAKVVTWGDRLCALCDAVLYAQLGDCPCKMASGGTEKVQLGQSDERHLCYI